jgi:hypothetical protein
MKTNVIVLKSQFGSDRSADGDRQCRHGIPGRAALHVCGVVTMLTHPPALQDQRLRDPSVT